MEDNSEAKESKTRPTTSKEGDEINQEPRTKEDGQRENRDINVVHINNTSSTELTLTTVYKARTSYSTSESEPFMPIATKDSNTESVLPNSNLLKIRSAEKRVQPKRLRNNRRARKTVAKRNKKKRSPAKRKKVVIRAPRQRLRRPQQGTESGSSICSQGSRVSVLACNLCGHRCCRERLELELRVQFCGSCRQKLREYLSFDHEHKTAEKSQKSKLTTMKTKVITTSKNGKSLRSEALQIGSRCSMLSPLLVSRNVVAMDLHPQSNHTEITPEMIYEALRRLTMWSEFVPTNSILNYLVQNYPMNWNKEELMAELANKLDICVKIGIVTKALVGDTWRLGCKMMNRRLQPNHVKLFWQLYHDSLRPVGKKGAEDAEH